MMRTLLLLGPLAGLLLAGCAGPVPDSNLTSSSPDLSSAPLGSYAAYELERARREAALTGASPGAWSCPRRRPPRRPRLSLR